MKAVQISKPKGNFEIVERPTFPSRGAVRSASKSKPAASATAMRSRKKDSGPDFSIRGYQVTRLPVASTQSAPTSHSGSPVNASESDGTVATAFSVTPAAGETSFCASSKESQPLASTAATPNMVAPAEAVALMPDDLPAAEAAPLMCAGITVFNSLRNSGARAGDLVAVQGIGGLGHLGIQYARQMGFRTIAIGRGKDKQPLAQKLGAHEYVDTSAGAPAEALQKFGGAKVILATAPDSKSISALVDGLAGGGKVLVVGAGFESLTVTPLQLIGGRKAIQGWPSGTAKDSEETLRFSSLCGVRPMIERYPLEKAAEAYDQMISGRARFRVVLTVA